MSRHHAFRFSWLALLGVAACAETTSYFYQPQGSTQWTEGRPTTAVDVPPEQPQGKVEITSFGIHTVTPDQGQTKISVLHVRMSITNDGDPVPWTINTQDQLVDIPGVERSRPVYVNTDVQTLPIVPVATRGKRVLDLYFRLPPDIRTPDKLKGFDFLWEVNTGTRPYASRTHFDRIEEEPMYGPDVTLWPGWAPYWWYDPWYDPWYPGPSYLHYGPVIAPGPYYPHMHH